MHPLINCRETTNVEVPLNVTIHSITRNKGLTLKSSTYSSSYLGNRRAPRGPRDPGGEISHGFADPRDPVKLGSDWYNSLNVTSYVAPYTFSRTLLGHNDVTNDPSMSF